MLRIRTLSIGITYLPHFLRHMSRHLHMIPIRRHIRMIHHSRRRYSHILKI